MGFCKVCKEENMEGSKFCVKCGTTMEMNENEASVVDEQADTVAEQQDEVSKIQEVNEENVSDLISNTVPENKNKKKSKKKLLIGLISAGVVGVLAIITVVLVVLFNKTAKVDIGSFVLVEYSGYDTIGKATVKIDEDELIEVVADSLKKDEDDIADDIKRLVDSFSYEVSDNGELANGDEVKIIVKYDAKTAEECKLEILNTSFSKEVDNLQKLIEIDPFQYLTIRFEGCSGDGKVSIEKDITSEAIKDLKFIVDKENGLYNGDKILISLDESESKKVLELGYQFTTTNKEYEVSGLSDFYEDVSSSIWASGYSDFISTWKNAEDYAYSLLFINEDNVPEVVCIGKKDKNIRILSWYKEKVVDNILDETGGIYYSNEDIFCIMSQKDEYRFYSLEKGKVECQHIAQAINNGDEIQYKWDDEVLSKGDYTKKMIDYYDTSNAEYHGNMYASNDMEYYEFMDAMSYLFSDYEISDWKRTYIEYIIIELYGCEDYSYNLMDTDGDGIPELFAMGKYGATGNIICVYYQGEVYENILPSTGGLSYIQNQNKYHVSSGRMDYYCDKIFHIEKGKCVDDFIGEYGLEDNTNVTDNSGNLLSYIYKWNDVLVSKESYYNMLRKEFDSFSSLSVNGIYDIERVLSILNSSY